MDGMCDDVARFFLLPRVPLCDYCRQWSGAACGSFHFFHSIMNMINMRSQMHFAYFLLQKLKLLTYELLSTWTRCLPHFPIFRNDMLAIMNSRAIFLFFSFLCSILLGIGTTARCTHFTFSRKKYRIKYWNYNVAVKNVLSKWTGTKSADLGRFLVFTLAAVSILFYMPSSPFLRIEAKINHQVVAAGWWNSEPAAHARA